MAWNLRTSVGIRVAIIAFLVLILLIPMFMVMGVISERKHRRNSAVEEVSEKWGQAQTIAGPVLTVPYIIHYKGKNNVVTTSTEYAHFLPDTLAVTGSAEPQIRYRGIYEVVLYTADVTMSGSFSPPDPEELKIPVADFKWQDAFISIGLSDMKGIKEPITIKWNNSQLSADPGIPVEDVLSSGVSTGVKLKPGTKGYDFSYDLKLNGSERLYFVPLGEVTTVSLKSPWDTPSFEGSFLPREREIRNDGFNASWRVLHLNRNYSQSWKGSKYSVFPSAFGVKFLLAVDEYQKSTRAAKYAIMFIGITFLMYFMMEVLGTRAIHPIQYLLVGLALLVFYTLLLAISEHISFGYSYLIASAAIIGQITLYSKSVLGRLSMMGIVAGVLVILYGFLYIVLQLEDYALLLGSIGIFGILALVMYLTRKVDWYNALKEHERSGGP